MVLSKVSNARAEGSVPGSRVRCGTVMHATLLPQLLHVFWPSNAKWGDRVWTKHEVKRLNRLAERWIYTLPNQRIRNLLSGCPSKWTSTLPDLPWNFREFALGMETKPFQNHIKTVYDGIRTANIENSFLQKTVLSSKGEPTTSRTHPSISTFSWNALV
jgi:hypothetical protein